MISVDTKQAKSNLRNQLSVHFTRTRLLKKNTTKQTKTRELQSYHRRNAGCSYCHISPLLLSVCHSPPVEMTSPSLISGRTYHGCVHQNTKHTINPSSHMYCTLHDCPLHCTKTDAHVGCLHQPPSKRYMCI